jgi:hypothetical protein
MRNLIFLVVTLGISSFSAADEYVPAYVRRDGTIVQGHFRSSPNGTAIDNYSTRGNFNPNSGRVSTRELEIPATSGGDRNSAPLQVGPRGGRYYINESGEKVYVRRQ